LTKKGEEEAKYRIDAVGVYVDEAIPRVESWARQVIAYVEDGDMLRT